MSSDSSLIPVLQAADFVFPYLYKFPGQMSDERILFITREDKTLLFARLSFVAISTVVGASILLYLAIFIAAFLESGLPILFLLLLSLLSLGLVGLSWWWITTMWQRSVAMVTTKRLVKLVYTTPFNRHVLSLPLDMIVDTGAYSKGFLQAIFRLSTLTARSSAASSGVATDDPDQSRVNKKYFYIENITFAEDLQHYITKLLEARKNNPDYLPTFRPFIPNLKGDQRKQFMEQYPEYWS